jgi:hypothetical protein
MGNARWSQSDWAQYSSTTSQKSQQQIFTQREIHPDLDPKTIKVREAVDSAANPNAAPIIVATDVTGSMGFLAEEIVKRGLGPIIQGIYTHQPIPDPQIMLMAVGDANCDRAPLQATQFEASVDPLTQQIEKIYIEGNGGGNGGESYPFIWWFATYKTLCDHIVKRHKKGYIFTIGDECPHKTLKREQIIKYTGLGCERDIDVGELLTVTQQFWHVFHLIVQPVASQPVVPTWQALLGERALLVEDHTKIPEIIVATIRLLEGQHDVTAQYDASTALVVQRAVGQLTPI